MPAVVWISIAVFVVSIVSGIAIAAVRGLRAWRDLGRLRRSTDEQLLALERAIATAEERTGVVEASSQRLAEALERLQRSLAVARVLADALAEARALVGGVRGSLPGK